MPTKPVHQLSSVVVTFALIITTFATVQTVLTKNSFDSRSSAAETTGTITMTPLVSGDMVNQDGNRLEMSGQKRWIGTAANPSMSFLGIRFVGQPLPAGSTLVSAHVSFVSPTRQWISVSTSIGAELSENPAPFSLASGPSSRTLTVGKRNFSDNVRWDANVRKSYDVTVPVSELLLSGRNSGVIALIIKGTGTAYGRKDIYGYSNTAYRPQLLLTYKTTAGSGVITPTDVPVPTTEIIPTAIPTTPPAATSVPTLVPPTAVPTTHTMPQAGAGGNSMAMGKWTPSRFDTCTKEQHEAYFVIGPDGKKYPTWHPPFGPGGCKFGHEHGRDPSKYEFWDEVRRHYAYDANVDGTISTTELASAGLPFGYVNEQIDAYYASHPEISTGFMRHEDHYGHKVQYANGEGDLDSSDSFGTSPTGGVVVPLRYVTPGVKWTDSGVRCYHLHKVHQGVSTPDALTNNLHEVFMHTKCVKGNQTFPASTTLLSAMIPFGAPGEFTRFCSDNRDQIISLGTTDANKNFPGTSEDGMRNIFTRDCVESTSLVVAPQWSSFPYEIWSGNLQIRRTNGQVVASNDGGWEVLDAVRYYNPNSPNRISYNVDWCYEKLGDRQARGGACSEMTNTYGSTPNITWDDPRSAFRGLHRGQYLKPHRIFNQGGSQYWYADPFGGHAQTTPFPGSIKQYISSVEADGIKIGNIDTRNIFQWLDSGNETVHAPN